MATKRETTAIGGNWNEVGNNIGRAMQEIAHELGGEELADQVLSAANGNNVIPEAEALVLLQSRHPGAAGMVMERAEKIAEQQQLNERSRVRNLGVRLGIIIGALTGKDKVDK